MHTPCTRRPPPRERSFRCGARAAQARAPRYAHAVAGEYEDELAVGQRLLGQRIRDRRDQLELPRRIIANRSGVGYNTLVSIEAGRRLPNLSTLHRIARTLETTARDLLAGIYPWDAVEPPAE